MKNIILLIVILSGFLNCFAQNEKSLLWEISGNGLENPSYLYGTIHFICPDDFNMDESIKLAFEEVEQLYLEIDFDDQAMLAEMQSLMIMQNGKSVSDFLSHEESEKLDQFFKSNIGAGLAQLGTIKPFALMSLMIRPLIGCEPKSFDLEFAEMAGKNQIEILGLETAAYQLSLFDSIPYNLQYEMLVELVENKDDGIKEFDEMVKAYKEKDLDALANMMDDSEWDYNGYEDLLIYNRNKNWIPLIEKAVQEMPTFIAVGSGHLPEEEGLIILLREAGYNVKPVL
ncbi:MAG: TraB/GumN family protein [Mariniphaga sp.]|nr:TraB/GumN family protein [Mariniphaga sp.]